MKWKAPTEAFWRDDVEVASYREIVQRSADQEYLRERLETFSGRMLSVIAGQANVDTDLRPSELREALLFSPNVVQQFLLAQAAGVYKARVAIERLAARVFSEDELKPFTTRSDVLDTRALVLALFARDPALLN